MLSTAVPTSKRINAASDNLKGKSIPAKKDIKKSLKGVLVKKKPKVPTAVPDKRSADAEPESESDFQPEVKRRRVEPDL